MSLRTKAVALLARREQSRAELARKLAAEGTPEEIDMVLSQLEQRGLLSDARCADAYLRSHGTRAGAAKLRQELGRRGIAGELASRALAEADLPSEFDRALGVWQKKFGAPPADAREWARQARFLQSRGFATDVIRRLLKQGGEEQQ